MHSAARVEGGDITGKVQCSKFKFFLLVNDLHQNSSVIDPHFRDDNLISALKDNYVTTLTTQADIGPQS